MSEHAWEKLRYAGRCADDDVPLIDTALALAETRVADLSPDRYRAHLQEMVGEVASAGPQRTAESAARALADVIAGKFGYRGDMETYDDLANADLVQVIDRRRGLPVALAVLYLHVGRAQGWDLFGLAFPAHFLIHLDQGGTRAIMDPFHGGITKTPLELRSLIKAALGAGSELTPGVYAPVSDRDVLFRLETNIMARQRRAGAVGDALDTIDRMLAFAPKRLGLWREKGVLEAQMGHVRRAIDALEHYLSLAQTDDLAHETAVLLQKLKQQLV